MANAQDIAARFEPDQADHLRAGTQFNANDAAGITASRTTIRFIEAAGLTVIAGDQHFVVAVGDHHFDQFITVAELNALDATSAWIAVCCQRGFLHLTLQGRHQQELILTEFTHGNDCGNVLVLGQIKHIRQMFSARYAGAFRNIVDLQPENLAVISEVQQILMIGRRKHLRDEIFVVLQ